MSNHLSDRRDDRVRRLIAVAALVALVGAIGAYVIFAGSGPDRASTSSPTPEATTPSVALPDQSDSSPTVAPSMATPATDTNSAATPPPPTSPPQTSPTTATASSSPRPALPSSGVAPPVGVVMKAGVTPTDPKAVRVISPNPSPVANPANLNGPRYHFGCADDPQRLNSLSLSPGSVVQFERGCRWGNVRITVRGDGTASQPILFHSVGDASKPAPTFSTQTAIPENRDAPIFTMEGDYMQMSGLTFAQAASVAIGVNGANSVLDNIEGDKVVIGVWIKGNGTKVWNSYFHHLALMSGTDGSNDDYGATGVVVEAHNVQIQGVTCRQCVASSPDYNKYGAGGDGSYVEVWTKAENLEVSYGYVDRSTRILEAGGKLGESARNMSVSYVYGNQISDQPIYLNPDGEYSYIDTSGMSENNNSFN
jgi:hypothetical protein